MVIEFSSNVGDYSLARVGKQISSQEAEARLHSKQPDQEQCQDVEPVRIVLHKGGVNQHTNDSRRRQSEAAGNYQREQRDRQPRAIRFSVRQQPQ